MGFFGVKKTSKGIFASDFRMNSLVRIDGDVLTYIGTFDNDDIEARELHRTILEYKNKLYFIPQKAKNISVLSLIDNKMDYYRLKDVDDKPRFSDAKIWNGKMYLFPRYLNQSLMVIDLENDNIEEDKNWNHKLVEKGIEVSQVFDTFSVTQNQNMFYIVGFNSNRLISYNSETDELKVDMIGNYSLRNVYVDKNQLWITMVEDPMVIRMNILDGEIREYISHDSTRRYHRVIKENGRILVIPTVGYNIGEIIDDNIECCFSIIGDDDGIQYSFGEYYENNGLLYFVPHFDNNIKIINLSNSTLKVIPYNNFEEYHLNVKRNHYIKTIDWSRACITEKKIFKLDDFLLKIKG